MGRSASPRSSSTATRPTPATWRCSALRHRRSSSASGWSRCSTRGSARVLHDRARRRLLGRDEHGGDRGRRGRRGGRQRAQVVVHRGRQPRRARSSSSWAVRPATPTGTRATPMVLVPLRRPRREASSGCSRTMGYYDEPLGHGEVSFTDVRVPRAPTSCSARAGLRDRPGPARPGARPPLHARHRPGRARARAGMRARPLSRTAFGKPIAKLGGNLERIADARIAINRSRLLVMHAAWLLDQGMSPRGAVGGQRDQGRRCRTWRSTSSTCAIQLHGGGGHDGRLPARRGLGRARARCASPTGPTRCTAAWSRRIELGKHAAERRRPAPGRCAPRTPSTSTPRSRGCAATRTRGMPRGWPGRRRCSSSPGARPT